MALSRRLNHKASFVSYCRQHLYLRLQRNSLSADPTSKAKSWSPKQNRSLKALLVPHLPSVNSICMLVGMQKTSTAHPNNVITSKPWRKMFKMRQDERLDSIITWSSANGSVRGPFVSPNQTRHMLLSLLHVGVSSLTRRLTTSFGDYT